MQRKISDEEAQQIIDKDLPGFKIIQHLPSDERRAEKGVKAQPEAVAPDLAAWQEKKSSSRKQSDSLKKTAESTDARAGDGGDEEDLYELFLKRERPVNDSTEYSAGSDEGGSVDSEEQQHSKIVVIASKDAPERHDGASEPKGVVVDGKTRKIIGYQG